MVVSRKEDALRHIQYLSTQAKDDPLFYIHNEVGYNYRMTNVQAAIGAAQMELLETFVKRKNENYEQYKQQFKNCSSVRLMEFRNGTYSNKWFYALEILDKTRVCGRLLTDFRMKEFRQGQSGG